MKRMVWLMMVVVVLVCVGQAFSQSEKQYVKVKTENLRSAPSGKKIAEVNGGTEMKVLEKSDKWAKVQFTGWIWAESLTSDPTSVNGYTIRVSHILVKTQAEADNLLAQLKQGADFAQLAEQKSTDRASGMKGGDLGYFGKGDFLDEFEDVAFKLKVNELSGVVETALGYHILKRIE